MKRTALEPAGLILFEPSVHRDDRGWFMETWNRARYTGLPDFVQDNVSRSRQGVLRGLHYQHPNGQGKLLTVLDGAVYDVAVDIRVGSPTFGRWTAVHLSAENARQFFVPAGFAHGFLSLADGTVLTYKCSALYDPDAEHTLRWDDPALGIDWPVDAPVLSPKDRAGLLLAALGERGALPPYPGGAG